MQTSLTLGQTLIGANQGHLVAAEGFRSMFRAHAPGTEEGGVPSATRNEADPPETKPLNFATHDWNATARRLHRLVFFFAVCNCSVVCTSLHHSVVCTVPSSAPYSRLQHSPPFARPTVFLLCRLELTAVWNRHDLNSGWKPVPRRALCDRHQRPTGEKRQHRFRSDALRTAFVASRAGWRLQSVSRPRRRGRVHASDAFRATSSFSRVTHLPPSGRLLYRSSMPRTLVCDHGRRQRRAPRIEAAKCRCSYCSASDS